MYIDRNHQMEMYQVIREAVYGLTPKSKRDLEVILNFLWECDIDYELIDLSRMKEEDLLSITVADREFIENEIDARKQAQLEADALINDHRAEI